jgi:hypothetical protein
MVLEAAEIARSAGLVVQIPGKNVLTATMITPGWPGCWSGGRRAGAWRQGPGPARSVRVELPLQSRRGGLGPQGRRAPPQRHGRLRACAPDAARRAGSVSSRSARRWPAPPAAARRAGQPSALQNPLRRAWPGRPAGAATAGRSTALTILRNRGLRGRRPWNGQPTGPGRDDHPLHRIGDRDVQQDRRAAEAAAQPVPEQSVVANVSAQRDPPRAPRSATIPGTTTARPGRTAAPSPPGSHRRSRPVPGCRQGSRRSPGRWGGSAGSWPVR